MLSSVLLLAATAFTGLVNAQNYSTSGPLTINPLTVDPNDRAAWCVSERTNCPLICGNGFLNNTCDPNTLNYNCTCTGGNAPNISNYQNTIPSLICGQWVANCVEAHPNDLIGIQGCHSVICGNETISAEGSGSSSDSSSTTTSATTAPTSSSTGDATAASTPASATSPAPTTTGTSAANLAIELGSSYGTGMLAAGLMAVFGLAL